MEGALPVTAQELRRATAADALLRRVARAALGGWPARAPDDDFKPFYLCRNQISLENGILLRGHKVIIPAILRDKITSELHSSHFGIVKMKAEARARYWFPGIDAALERVAGACAVCAALRPAPPRAPSNLGPSLRIPSIEYT